MASTSKSQQITFIVFNPMLFEEFNYLLSVRFHPMVFLLVLHIFDQSVFRFDGIRESTVTILPAAKVGKEFVVLDKLRGGKFDVLDEIRKRNRRMKMRNNMEMVVNAVDPVQMTFLVLQNAGNVTKKLIALVCGERLLTMLGPENDLIDYLCMGAHGSC